MEHLELYLGLGSNDIRKEYWIDKAIELINNSLAMQYTALSDKIVTKSWGFDGPDFLNCVVRYDIPAAGQDPQLHARAMLHIFQDIERQLGRTHKTTIGPDGQPAYHDRTIDIDILLYGKLRLVSPDLTIPHPQMHLRDFVMVPLRQVISERMI